MINVVITPSKNKTKKFDARIDDRKTVSFGAKGMSDFTLHKDEARKQRYINRHKGMNEKWNDATTAGFWSRWLLWEKPTLQEAVKNINRKFNLHAVLKL